MFSFHLRGAATALTVALVLGCAPAWGQDGQPLQLQKSMGPAPEGEGLPTFVTADRLEGLSEGELEATGNAEIRKGGMILQGDRLRYWQDREEVEGEGNVYLFNQGNEVRGPRLRMDIDTYTGIIDEPVFKLAPRVVTTDEGSTGRRIKTDRALSQTIESRGMAHALRFEGQNHYRVTDGHFTTCQPGQDDWYVNADELRIDMEREVVTAYGASLSFMDMTTPEFPWFEFPLNNKRKTGLLPPTIGVSGKTGPEASLPFYWNIAPNYDATITPRFMEKRGVQLMGEFRYLQQHNNGILRYEVLPADKDDDGGDRWGYSIKNNSRFGNGWSGMVNINRVSDDDYFRDLSSNLSIATQTYLPREGYIQYAGSKWWNARARIQKFQTLQDPLDPLPIPYNREPQVTLNALNQDVRFLDLGLQSEFVSFRHPTLQEGRRAIAYPSIAVPFTGTSGYIKPKIGVHSTWYNLSDVGVQDSTPTRYVPIYSVDSALAFERETNWLGRDWVQTLEPRLYYLRVPYRNQNRLPNFDTGLADLSFSQFFAENIFIGGDRIAEANQLTAAVTTRLIEPSSGQEIIRALIGQRYYFGDQRVTIENDDGSTSGGRTSSESSILAALSGRLSRDWTTDTAVQYGAEDSELERFNMGLRYSPAPASIVNLSYRYTNENQTTIGAIRSVDLSVQWPLAQRWYGMTRLNYDIEGDKLVEKLAGIEYNAGCWILRVVYHQFQTASQQDTSLFFVQLELNGFSSIGSNPIDALRRNIPGYTPSNYIDSEQSNVFDRSEVVSPWGTSAADNY